MALRLLADFIRQCLLARWEAEYESADPLEIPPEVQISVPLLLCKGQEVKFKVCATANVTCWLQLDTSDADASPPPEIHLQNDIQCFAIDHEWKVHSAMNRGAESRDIRKVLFRSRLLQPSLG